MACMPTLSPLSPTACGGTGVIIPTVGVAILTMAGTAGTAPLGAGDSVEAEARSHGGTPRSPVARGYIAAWLQHNTHSRQGSDRQLG